MLFKSFVFIWNVEMASSTIINKNCFQLPMKELWGQRVNLTLVKIALLG